MYHSLSSYRSLFLLFALGLGTSMLASGCYTPRGSRGGDDDDATSTDDDDTGTTDDDDTIGDDDDDDDDTIGDDDDDDDDDTTPTGFDPAAVSFGVEYLANSGAGGVGITGALLTTYWQDDSNQVELCEQRIEFTGSATFGPVDGCSVCEGLLVVDDTSPIDVSNPGLDPTQCDPANFVADPGSDIGMLLLTTPENDGLGDFLELALVSAESGIAAGAVVSTDGQTTFQSLSDELGGYGLTFTHLAYTRNTAESLAGQLGLASIMAPAEVGSEWYAGQFLFVDPNSNPSTGLEMSGQYAGQGLFRLTFSK